MALDEHEIMELSAQWIALKEQERIATETRRDIEDRLKALCSVPDNLDGTANYNGDGYMVRIVGRIDRKVDADLVQEIAAEHGLSAHLSTLFRWKPDIDMKAWKNADRKITDILSSAIVAKPGRPSFQITKKDN
jgi:predicted metal-dependent phosphoesterase TrpH